MRSPGLGLVLLAAAAAIGAHPEPAEAHHSASSWRPFYRERYAVCTDARAAARVHCVGPLRARPALLAALAIGDLTPGLDHEAWIAPAHDAAVDAAYFHVQDAVPALRRWLALHLDPGESKAHGLFDKQGLRTEAAFALARLGDPASALAIADLVRELETDGYGATWEGALGSLAELDPARASTYALDFVSRQTDFATSLPGGSGKLQALDLIRADDAAAAAPVLARLAAEQEHRYDHAYCELMATRVRLEPGVHADVREQLVGSYSGTWLAGCAESVLERFGNEPEDAAALVRHLGRPDAGMDFGVSNIAYTRILELEVTLAGRHDAAATRARDELRRGLTERSAWPHVADPASRSYAPHFVALHEAALAGLGDTAAATRLAALIDDPADHTGTAWIAALYALRLGLDGAVDRTAALVARGPTYVNELRTGFLYQDVRRRVLDALVARAPDDARWTVMLLDGELRSDAAEHALDLLARTAGHAPRGTCEAIVAAAPTAPPEAVEHAFLALTALGDTCLPPIEALADQRGVPDQVRGAALEFTAVLESPRLCAHLALARTDGVWGPAIERAVALRAPRCGPTRAPPAGHGDQPLPPRVFHQGE